MDIDKKCECLRRSKTTVGTLYNGHIFMFEATCNTRGQLKDIQSNLKLIAGIDTFSFRYIWNIYEIYLTLSPHCEP